MILAPLLSKRRFRAASGSFLSCIGQVAKDVKCHRKDAFSSSTMI